MEAETKRQFGLSLTRDEQTSLELWKRRQATHRDDRVFRDQQRLRTIVEVDPTDRSAARQWQILERGWSVPVGTVFPLGDNRDDSRDGRFFGPVTLRRVLGRAEFHYWPPTRWGSIR